MSAVPPSISSIKRKMSGNFTNKANIVDDFIIYKKLGEGKFGMVNLVRHKKTNTICALKKIPKALIKSNMMIDQLALEMRIQSCLKNANILEMYGFFDDKTHLYIVLEYMDGGTLYERLKKEKLGEKEASVIIRQMTSAVDYLHDIGIAHRDIKPENIVISNVQLALSRMSISSATSAGLRSVTSEERPTAELLITLLHRSLKELSTT